MSILSKDALSFPEEDYKVLEPYLPTEKNLHVDRAWTTLTFATSLDSQLSISNGVQTKLSGPKSKAVTHYLRSQHDAILVGVGTVIADDPSLNCRLEGAGGFGGPVLKWQPRPIIIDPFCRWDFTEQNKIFTLVKSGKGKCPFIITTRLNPPSEKKAILEAHGGKFIAVPVRQRESGDQRFDWDDMLRQLKMENLNSVMIEGGGVVINSLLEQSHQSLVDSVIITIAPTWLGQGGVVVSPRRSVDANGGLFQPSRLTNVVWHPCGEDVILCGNMG